MDPDHDNLRAAFDWLQARGAQEDLERLAGACAPYWHARGHLSEGWIRLSEALASADPVPTAARGRALSWAGQIAITMGDLGKATEIWQEAVSVWKAVGNQRGLASAMHIHAMVEEHQLHWEAAATLYEEELALWREIGDALGAAITLSLLGGVAYGQGDIGRARALESEAASLFRSLQEDRLAALAEWYLGLFASAEGRHLEASRRFRDSLAVLLEVGDAVWLFKPLVGLAAVAAAVGQEELAAELLGAVDRLLRRSGARLLPFDRPVYERAMQAARSALGDPRFMIVLAAGEAFSPDDYLVVAEAVVAATGLLPAGSPPRGGQ
jgi:tetratricopeptide (TPR) repeat protein